MHVTEQLWKLLNVIIRLIKSIFEGHPIKRNLKQKLLTFKLFPIYECQSNFLEGVQQFDSSWTLEETINKMEEAL